MAKGAKRWLCRPGSLLVMRFAAKVVGRIGMVRVVVVAWRFRVGVDGAERSSRLIGAVQGSVHGPTLAFEGCTQPASNIILTILSNLDNDS